MKEAILGVTLAHVTAEVESQSEVDAVWQQWKAVYLAVNEVLTEAGRRSLSLRLEETVNAIRIMSGRLVDRKLRDEILNQDLQRLIASYAQGWQRAATRFVLQASKAGDMALTMESPFTEEDLLGEAE